MSIVVIYLAYLLVGVGLTLVVGLALSGYGRVYLLDALDGNDKAAEVTSKLHVIAFYLLALGFVALSMRATGDAVTARQAIQLLAAKIGELLLVLGVLYLASIALLGRLRRRLRMQAGPAAEAPPAQAARPDPAAPPAALARRTQPAQALWRPAPRKVTR